MGRLMASDNPVAADGCVVLLICTVGGTPEPLVKALLHWQPQRVLFVPSEQTRAQVDAVLRAFADAAGQPLSPGQYAIRAVPDAEDLVGCVQSMRTLDAEVADWLARGGENYRVVVDFTAGTKCMSAALALVARRWQCHYSYVGGERRTKEGVGVVETGTERVVHTANPWDALGYQAVEDAITVFNHGGYAAAAAQLDRAIKAADRPDVRRELSTLKAVIDAYAAWDRFDHKGAKSRFDDALKNRNDLSACFPAERAAALVGRLERHRLRVAELALQTEPAIEWVVDLLHNADRRAAERRFDDAVARLYRAFEALAQVRLREKWGIPDTKAVSLAQLPDALRTQWANRGRDGRAFMLALQDAYRVLLEFDDAVGRAFVTLGLAEDTRSPLVARNSSILAHGFQPVSRSAYQQLERCIGSLLAEAGVDACSPGRNDWLLPMPCAEMLASRDR